MSEEYHARRLTLIEYLHVKVAMADWHGASDACNDLREMEAEERGKSQRALADKQPTREQLRRMYAP
jgi:hypothetical protein